MDTIKCGSIYKDELVISRIFNVQREVLWNTLTTEHWKSWWLPKSYKLYESELRPGGKYYGCIEHLDNKDFCIKGEFREVVTNEKIVMTDSFSDKASKVAPASYYGMPQTWSPETKISATFEDLGDKTKLTLKHTGLKGIDCSNIEEDVNKFFDELEDEIKKEMKRDYTVVQGEKLRYQEN